jgi:hypothetical protein
MKAGDLVTLSQYGAHLGTIPVQYRNYWRDTDPIFGIVTEIQSVDNPWGHLSKNEQRKYIVRWNVDDLKGRTWHGRYFYRNDLKFFK